MTVELEWTPNTEVDLLSYRIYVGLSPGVYDQSFNINGDIFPFIPILAPVSTTQLILDDGKLYYFAISAIDMTGNESAKSPEVSKINKYTNFRTS